MKIKATIKKTLRPDTQNKRFVHMCIEGEFDTIPQPGMKIVTGNVETMIGNVSFTPQTGWMCEEWDCPPDLGHALEEVKRGQSFEKLIKEHLAAGWREVKTKPSP